MTWKEFKEAVAAAGVEDDDDLDWINTHGNDLIVRRERYDVPAHEGKDEYRFKVW